ncbi:MAG: NifB/NifX family molybdenum-iron cluster-binding protein [Candidatus Aminicenantes bacterium]
MKIAVSALSPDIDDAVDPRFGRCPYFLIVDSESMEFESVQNPYLDAPSGAGIQSGQLVASKGAQTVLTGNCGPNAYQTLTAAGVEVVTGVSGTIRAAVKAYASGSGFQKAGQANVPSHFGMGAGAGRVAGGGMGMGRGLGAGRGQGMGRGMGTGRGMGMGRGMGAGQGSGPGFGPSSPAVPPQGTVQGDLSTLKEEARNLRDHLERITKKIADLEKASRKEPK